MGSFQGLLSQQFVSQKVGRIAAEPVCAVRPEHPTLEVVELLAEESCGAVIVNSENDEIVGIITERDFLLRKIDWEQGTAEEIMTAAPSVIRKSGSIAKALHMMSVGGFRHLPVVHRKRYVEGVISVKNIVQAIYDILLKLHVGEQCELIGSHRSIQRYFCSTVEIFQPEVPIFVRPESSVHDALQKLKKSRSGAVTVVDEKEVLVG
ncbi:CBS domain-containing protein, partial [bacterium]|nr:CBS domain-containing protein [bacterium]